MLGIESLNQGFEKKHSRSCVCLWIVLFWFSSGDRESEQLFWASWKRGPLAALAMQPTDIIPVTLLNKTGNILR